MWGGLGLGPWPEKWGPNYYYYYFSHQYSTTKDYGAVLILGSHFSASLLF